MPIDFDENTFPSQLQDINEIVARVGADTARTIAELYRDTLKSMIENGSFDLKETVYSNDKIRNRNRKKYLARKDKAGYGDKPLYLTGNYVESITVFEDTSIPNGDGVSENEENEENTPRFYIKIRPYNNIYGYYIDVKDIYHDPPPFNASKNNEFATLFNIYRNNIIMKKKLRKTKGFVTKGVGGVPMRWLKKALEYGSGPIPARYHWGYVSDVFRREYGSDSEIQEMSRQVALEQINSRLGNV